MLNDNFFWLLFLGFELEFESIIFKISMFFWECNFIFAVKDGYCCRVYWELLLHIIEFLWSFDKFKWGLRSIWDMCIESRSPIFFDYLNMSPFDGPLKRGEQVSFHIMDIRSFVFELLSSIILMNDIFYFFI